VNERNQISVVPLKLSCAQFYETYILSNIRMSYWTRQNKAKWLLTNGNSLDCILIPIL